MAPGAPIARTLQETNAGSTAFAASQLNLDVSGSELRLLQPVGTLGEIQASPGRSHATAFVSAQTTILGSTTFGAGTFLAYPTQTGIRLSGADTVSEGGFQQSLSVSATAFRGTPLEARTGGQLFSITGRLHGGGDMAMESDDGFLRFLLTGAVDGAFVIDASSVRLSETDRGYLSFEFAAGVITRSAESGRYTGYAPRVGASMIDASTYFPVPALRYDLGIDNDPTGLFRNAPVEITWASTSYLRLGEPPVSVVPEPTTTVLIFTGLTGFAWRRVCCRRRRAA